MTGMLRARPRFKCEPYDACRHSAGGRGTPVRTGRFRFRWSVAILLALGSAAHGTLLASEAADVKSIPRLPTVSGKDLNGKPWKAPADFPADRTLVILGFEQEQQAAIDTWTAGLGLTQPGNTLPWIEMPVIDEPGMVMRWIIDTGMQRGIPGKDARGHVWTAYTDRKAFLNSCGIGSANDIHVLVVSRDGAILALESGRHSEDAAERILAVLRGG